MIGATGVVVGVLVEASEGEVTRGRGATGSEGEGGEGWPHCRVERGGIQLGAEETGEGVRAVAGEATGGQRCAMVGRIRLAWGRGKGQPPMGGGLEGRGRDMGVGGGVGLEGGYTPGVRWAS